MAKPPVSEQVQVNFRMPADLRDRIKVAADVSGRSQNAEIIARLEASFDALLPREGRDEVAYFSMAQRKYEEFKEKFNVLQQELATGRAAYEEALTRADAPNTVGDLRSLVILPMVKGLHK